MTMLTSRRTLLVACGAAAIPLGDRAAAAGVSPLAQGAALMGFGKASRPSAVGHKFYPGGGVREFAGSTVICHIRQGSPLQVALRGIHEEALDLPFMQKFTLLPVSSLHMTVFAGVDEAHRTPPLWPADVPTNALMEACNAWSAERLHTVHTGGGLFTMRVQPNIDLNALPDFIIKLVPATAKDEEHIRNVRDRISAALQIRSPDHATYGFHISLGYVIRWLNAEETAAFQRAYKGWTARLSSVLPEFELGPPEFCIFKDMYSFERIFYLSN